MDLAAFAKQLKFDLGLATDLPRTEEGGYILLLEPRLKVELHPLEEGAVLRTKVGKAGEGEVLTTLMHANLLGQGTGGGVLGLEETGQWVVFTEESVRDMPYGEFRSWLEQFCNFAEYWQKKVKG